MKALLLLLLAASAGAQSVDPCTGLKSDSPATITPIAIPMVCANEKGRTVEFSLQGAVAWRYCLNTSTKRYDAQVAAVTRAEVFDTPGLAVDLFKAGMAADEATINRLSSKYAAMVGKFTDPAHAAVWCPYRAQIAAGAPKAAIWVTTSTVVYRLNEAGTELGAQVGTAKRDEVVDGTSPRTFSRMTFCPWNRGTSPFKTYIRCAEQKAVP